MRKAVVGVALVAIVACGGGGGGSTSTPTSPSPIPSVDTCNSLGGTSSKAGQTILNGSSCAPERSSIVLVNLRNSDNQAMGACSGTVIAPRVVLTAAHCLDEGVATVRIWVGVGVEVVAASFTALRTTDSTRPEASTSASSSWARTFRAIQCRS